MFMNKSLQYSTVQFFMYYSYYYNVLEISLLLWESYSIDDWALGPNCWQFNIAEATVFSLYARLKSSHCWVLIIVEHYFQPELEILPHATYCLTSQTDENYGWSVLLSYSSYGYQSVKPWILLCNIYSWASLSLLHIYQLWWHWFPSMVTNIETRVWSMPYCQTLA
jgi:hypothetical protein